MLQQALAVTAVIMTIIVVIFLTAITIGHISRERKRRREAVTPAQFAAIHAKCIADMELEDADDELRFIHRLSDDEIRALELQLAGLPVDEIRDRLRQRLGDWRSADLATPYFLRR